MNPFCTELLAYPRVLDLLLLPLGEEDVPLQGEDGLVRRLPVLGGRAEPLKVISHVLVNH